MKKFETEKITDLSEIFFALMGGCPEDICEIENFMKTSPLNQLMFASDIERIIKYDGFFPDETVDAVYSLLPVEIPLKSDKNEVLTVQKFRQINAARIALPASRVIDISFPKAISVYTRNYPDKNKKLVRILCNIRNQQEENLLYHTNSNLNSEVKNEKKTPIKTKRPCRSARKTRYGSRYKKGEMPQFVVEQMQKVKEEKERQQKEQEKEIKNALKNLKAEQGKEEKHKKQEASKIYIQKKNRRQQKQILQEREQQQQFRQEEQIKVWREIARLDNKKQEMEKRKNTPFEQLSVEDQEKEKQRRRMAELRKGQPRKDTRKKIGDLPPEEQEIVREANRRRNAVYRERHREELRASRNEARARLKQDNPELLKEMDRKNNAKPARKKASRRYYLMNKEKCAERNRNNPNRSIINKKYKMKKRLIKTGPVLSSLIQGLLNTKSR